jgi:hypothetical protein
MVISLSRPDVRTGGSKNYSSPADAGEIKRQDGHRRENPAPVRLDPPPRAMRLCRQSVVAPHSGRGMMMKSIAMVALGATMALMIGASPVLAKPLPNGGVTREEVAEWLKGKGHKAEIKPNDDGVMMVSSAIGGVNYDLNFYGCVNKRCAAIEYLAGWTPMDDVSLEDINAWNARKRYVFGFRDDEMNIWAQYDVDVAPAGSSELMDESLATWEQLVVSFKAFIDSGGEVE